MVTVIESEDPWRNVGKNLATGLVEGYQGRSDEASLKKTIEGLDPNAPAQDVLKAILGTKTYSPQAKRQMLTDYLGAQEVERSVQKGREAQTLESARLDIERNKAAAQKANMERQRQLQSERNDILKDKNQIKQGEKENERSNIKAIVDQLDLSPEKKEALGNSITYRGAEDLLKQQLTNADKLSPLERKLQDKSAEEFIDLTKEIATLDSTLEDINYAEDLSNELGYKGTLWSALGLSQKGKELEGVAFPLIQPILKMLAPSGAIAAQKLKTTQEKYAIRGSDAPWNRKAKLDALRRFANQAKKRATDRMELMKNSNFNPNAEALKKFDRESETVVDAMLDYDLIGEEVKLPDMPAAGQFKGKTVTSPEGQKYYSDGTRWVKK